MGVLSNFLGTAHVYQFLESNHGLTPGCHGPGLRQVRAGVLGKQ